MHSDAEDPEDIVHLEIVALLRRKPGRRVGKHCAVQALPDICAHRSSTHSCTKTVHWLYEMLCTQERDAGKKENAIFTSKIAFSLHRFFFFELHELIH